MDLDLNLTSVKDYISRKERLSDWAMEITIAFFLISGWLRLVTESDMKIVFDLVSIPAVLLSQIFAGLPFLSVVVYYAVCIVTGIVVYRIFSGYSVYLPVISTLLVVALFTSAPVVSGMYSTIQYQGTQFVVNEVDANIASLQAGGEYWVGLAKSATVTSKTWGGFFDTDSFTATIKDARISGQEIKVVGNQRYLITYATIAVGVNHKSITPIEFASRPFTISVKVDHVSTLGQIQEPDFTFSSNSRQMIVDSVLRDGDNLIIKGHSALPSFAPMGAENKGTVIIKLPFAKQINPSSGDRDGDGIPDSQDLCPDDATNTCTIGGNVIGKILSPITIALVGGAVFMAVWIRRS